MKNLLVILLIFACSSQISAQYNRTKLIVSPNIELIPLGEGFFIHQSYTESEQYGRFSSNGLLYMNNGKALMIDTPMTNEETELVYRFLMDSLDATVSVFVGCHYHDDCIGGVGFLKSKNVEIIYSEKTAEICNIQHLPLPDRAFSGLLKIDFEGTGLELFYPGGGHTIDNIVAFFPESSILFGGCLIKSLSSSGLGNTTDAVVDQWAASVKNVLDRYGNAEIVIPGHGEQGGIDILHHTIKLIEN